MTRPISLPRRRPPAPTADRSARTRSPFLGGIIGWNGGSPRHDEAIGATIGPQQRPSGTRDQDVARIDHEQPIGVGRQRASRRMPRPPLRRSSRAFRSGRSWVMSRAVEPPERSALLDPRSICASSAAERGSGSAPAPTPRDSAADRTDIKPEKSRTALDEVVDQDSRMETLTSTTAAPASAGGAGPTDHRCGGTDRGVATSAGWSERAAAELDEILAALHTLRAARCAASVAGAPAFSRPCLAAVFHFFDLRSSRRCGIHDGPAYASGVAGSAIKTSPLARRPCDRRWTCPNVFRPLARPFELGRKL